MALYEFRCPECRSVELNFTIGQAPAAIVCPQCGREATRLFSPPRLSIAGTGKYQLVDKAAKSAHEPDVVSRVPGGRAATTQYTTNPLHQKLPRP